MEPQVTPMTTGGLATQPPDEAAQCAALASAMLADLGAVKDKLGTASDTVTEQAYAALYQTSSTCVSQATFAPWKAAAAKLAEVMGAAAAKAGNADAQSAAQAVQLKISTTKFGSTSVNWLLPVGAVALAVAGWYAYQQSKKDGKKLDRYEDEEGEGEEFSVSDEEVEDDGDDDFADLAEHQPEDDLAGGGAWERATKKRVKWSRKK